MKKYKVIIFNKQGAEESTYCRSKAEVKEYIDGWHDPKNLTAYVYCGGSEPVGVKPFGRKAIKYTVN